MNCVPDPLLDVRSDANTPYNNIGADELSTLVESCSLVDELRVSLGMEFASTHTQTTAAGYCRTRIDQQYLPQLDNAHWTCKILDTQVGLEKEPDHDTLIADLEFKTQRAKPKSKPLATVNSELVYEPTVNDMCRRLIRKAIARKRKGYDPIKNWNKLKFNTLKLLKAETRVFRKKKNIEIEETVECINHLKRIHDSQRTISRNDRLKREGLMNKLKELRTQLNPPKPRRSLFSFRKEETMSREMWSNTYRSSKGSNFINHMDVVQDWNNPPPKDTQDLPKTADVTEAARQYHKHLSAAPPSDSETEAATKRIEDLLSRWGIDKTI